MRCCHGGFQRRNDSCRNGFQPGIGFRGGNQVDDCNGLNRELGDEVEELLQRSARLLGEVLDGHGVLLIHREREFEARREVSIQAALPDAGPLGHVIEGCVHAVLAEDLNRCCDERAPVTGRRKRPTILSTGQGHMLTVVLPDSPVRYWEGGNMPVGREPQDVVVVTGIGGMGVAIARRLGPGRQLVLADFNEAQLNSTAELLRGEGQWVTALRTDVSNAADVIALAREAATRGRVVAVVHTAGVSPVQAGPERVISVDVMGTAHLLDAFLEPANSGMAVVCIASMAGAMVALPADVERLLATTPTADLAALPVLNPANLDAASAYPIAKRANQLRVQAMAGPYGAKGARVVSISPGVISTPMGQQELAGASGDQMRGLIQMSATGRLGTPDDIASAVEFLVGPHASFITGTDVLVDGGAVAAIRSM